MVGYDFLELVGFLVPCWRLTLLVCTIVYETCHDSDLSLNLNGCAGANGLFVEIDAMCQSFLYIEEKIISEWSHCMQTFLQTNCIAEVIETSPPSTLHVVADQSFISACVNVSAEGQE